MDAPFKGFRKWIGGGTNEHFRRRINIRPPKNLPSSLIFDHCDQLHGINIKDTFGIGMIAKLLMIP